MYGWFNLNDKYFSLGTVTTTYVSDSSNDYASEKFQTEMTAFNAALEECEGCDEKWNMPNTLESWFREMHKTARDNGCQVTSSTGDYLIEPNDFYNCLCKFIVTDEGRGYAKDLIYTGTISPNPAACTVELTGFRQTIVVKKIEQIAIQGVQYLKDIRAIEDKYAPPGTFSYSQDMLDYELYVVFTKETLLSVGLSLVAVFFVVLFVTGSLPVTFLVVLAVLLVDFFLVALIYYWGLTFNTVVVINIVIAIGLAVDYSAHISHTYLTVVPPPELQTNAEKRMFKARAALAQMGSSVFHGGFSTFLAIITLSAAKSYIFKVFFKLWFGIIVFGMANGFLLLPVILSLVGPLANELPTEEHDRVNKKGAT